MFLEDTRIGGRTRYILTEKPLMFIPDEMRKCVAYVGYEMADGTTRMVGSAFFVGRQFDPNIPQIMFGYVVTARHLLEKIRDKGLTSVLLRVNTPVGARWLDTEIGKWRVHSDTTIDVAVLRFSLSSIFDHKQWPMHGFCDSETIQKEQIGIGEDVFFMGLFSQHYGQERNIPIARIGNIAAMPEELVSTEMGLMKGYLVEARSIGGLSGSPVFINTGGGGMHRQFIGTLPRFHLLGLVHGHFTIKNAEADAVSDDGLNEASINTGIAIVVPAEQIREVIDLFSEEDLKIAEDIRKQALPEMDSSN